MRVSSTADRVRTIRLGDKRRLAFAEFGDPSGPPLLFFHGWGDSRLTRHPDDDATARLGVRLITIDRPGAGHSDFQPRRRLIDWPADVAELADALSIERFAVLGWSGGGPHALACAKELPDRVSRLGIAAGFAPVRREAGARQLPLELRLGRPVLRWAPGVGRLVFARLPGQYRRDPAKAFENQFGKRLPRCDQAILADPRIRANIQAGAVEALRAGSRGFAQELSVLFGRPWGFEPDEIRVPTWLWYGSQDPLVPAAMGRYLSQEIPGATLTLTDEHGHLLVFPYWREILLALTR